jgi:hypothetical protein
MSGRASHFRLRAQPVGRRYRLREGLACCAADGFQLYPEPGEASHRTFIVEIRSSFFKRIKNFEPFVNVFCRYSLRGKLRSEPFGKAAWRTASLPKRRGSDPAGLSEQP